VPIEAIDINICSAELKSGHPELFHYTSRAAFQAIIQSNTLWATHFRHFTDDTEISTLKPLLFRTVADVFYHEVKKRDHGTRNLYFRRGGGAAHARRFIASLYAATFEQTDTRLDRRRLHHIIFYAFG
jgi:hypothetical protein